MPRVQQRATPARATLARATVELQALRTCASCGRLVPSKHDLFDAGRAGRLCSSCYDRWAHEQDARQDAQQDTMADADAVYRWAAGLLTAVEESGSMPIRIVALATTSLERDAEVVEVAIVDHGGCVLVNSLVQPQRPIPAHATAIHGITDAQVAEAPTLPEMWPQIATALRHARVVAYDAAFAADVLSQGARRHGLTRLTCTWESLGEACRACSDDGEHLLSLQALCREMGIVAEEYQVLGEAQAAIAVIDMLAQRASQAAGRLHGYHEPVASGSDRHEALGSHLRDWLEPVPTARNRYGNIS